MTKEEVFAELVETAAALSEYSIRKENMSPINIQTQAQVRSSLRYFLAAVPQNEKYPAFHTPRCDTSILILDF